jgi:hypothetical protein
VSIVFLWVGLILVAVGVSLVVLEGKVRRGDVRTTGRIVGHSERREGSQRMYRAVVEFADLAGRKRLAESNVASNAPLGRVGGEVGVVLDLQDADAATIESRGVTVLGVVLALFGAVSVSVFFLTFRTDPLSVAMSVAVSAVIGYKLVRLGAQHRGLSASWKEFKDKALRGRTFDAAERDRITWADPAALAAVRQRQQWVNRAARPVLVAAGVGLVVLALHLQRTTTDFLARTVPGTGRVVAFASNDSSDGTTYAAVVEFEDGGEPHRLKDPFSSSTPLYRIGDQVPVLHVPGEPARACIDRGLWNRWIPWLVGALGALMALGGAGLATRRAADRDSGPATLRPAT